MSFLIPFQKKSLLIKKYVLFVLAYPWRLHEFTGMMYAEDLGTIEALKDV